MYYICPFTRYWAMGQAKITLKHNAIDCLSAPSYARSNPMKYKLAEIERYYLTTSFSNLRSRYETPNPLNAIRPPLTYDRLLILQDFVINCNQKQMNVRNMMEKEVVV
eukprot:53728_1